MERHIQADNAFLEWMVKMSKNVVHIADAWYAAVKWADSHPQWISVEDNLPKERGQYFVYTAADQSWQSEWMQDKSGEWHWFCSPMTVGTIANVTHWMPIVPPRKEANNE